MAIYTFRNKRSKREWTDVMSYDEKVKFLEANPNVESVPVAMNIGDPVRLGKVKQSSDFRQVLQKAKKAHPHGTINTGNISEV